MKLMRPSCFQWEYEIVRQAIKALRGGMGIQIVDGKGKPIGKPSYVEPEKILDLAA